MVLKEMVIFLKKYLGVTDTICVMNEEAIVWNPNIILMGPAYMSEMSVKSPTQLIVTASHAPRGHGPINSVCTVALGVGHEYMWPLVLFCHQ